MGGRTPTFAITLESHAPDAVAAHLAERDIAVWSGNYYALEIMERLGLPDGAVRIGFVHYNTVEEVDRLLKSSGGCAHERSPLVGAERRHVGPCLARPARARSAPPGDAAPRNGRVVSGRQARARGQVAGSRPRRSRALWPSRRRTPRPFRIRKGCWRDWLAFLDGARHKGGLVLRA